MGKGRPKGTPKTGGRQKGTPNKVTAPLKELIKQFAIDKWPEFLESWENMESNKDKCDTYTKVLQYLLPKMASVDVSGKVEKPTWEEELKQMSEIK